MSSICSTLLKKNAEQHQIFSRCFWTKHEGNRPLEGATLRAFVLCAIGPLKMCDTSHNKSYK